MFTHESHVALAEYFSGKWAGQLSEKWSNLGNIHWYTIWASNVSANGLLHDDVIKWKHFPHYWPFVLEIHQSPVNSHHRSQ